MKLGGREGKPWSNKSKDDYEQRARQHILKQPLETIIYEP